MLYVMAGLYIIAGVYHFVNPKAYLKLMPPYLPYHLPLIYLSGLAEIVLGLGLFFPMTQSISAWGIIALLIAIYPANYYMYKAKVILPFTKKPLPDWAHALRFFTQLGLMYWAYLYT